MWRYDRLCRAVLCAALMLAQNEASSRQTDEARSHEELTVETCREALQPSAPRPDRKRLVTANDVVSLRDIGAQDDYQLNAHPLAVSPDGRWVAFQMRRAMPFANNYCMGLFVAPVGHAKSAIRILDVGGEFALRRGASAKLPSVPSGMPLVARPAWSPDGRRIAYMRQDNGILRVWIAAMDGSGVRPVSPPGMTPTSFSWSRLTLNITGRFAKGPSPERLREERSGIRYDDRFWPIADGLPNFEQAGPPETIQIPLEDDQEVGKAAQHLALVAYTGPQRAKTVRRIWIAPDDPELIGSPRLLHISDRRGGAPCRMESCDGVLEAWDSSASDAVLFLSLTGPGRSKFRFYRWEKAARYPRLVLETDDVLSGCELAGDDLICTIENSTAPRRIARLSSVAGRVTTIFDPNPEFADIALTPPRRLYWRNRFGIQTFGDLLVPSSSIYGTKAPLVIVQYDSRGFLRGGTGDEYPIQLLAAHGFAVLSLTRPLDYGLFKSPKGVERGNRETNQDWNDRRSVQSTLEVAVSDLVEKGIVDPRRIAISGLSDGAATASFALINSTLFSAALFSTCCADPTTLGPMMGPAYARDLSYSGFPDIDDPTGEAWRPASLRHNLDRVKASILIQASDREYRLALPTYQALADRGAKIDLFVFPDEYHVKWQPAHRLAIYERNLAWLKTWADR